MAAEIVADLRADDPSRDVDATITPGLVAEADP